MSHDFNTRPKPAGHSATVRVGILIVAAFLQNAVFGQASVDEGTLEPLRRLILDNRLADAERLVHKALPTPGSEHKQSGVFNISAYDAVWTLIVTCYLNSNDYANAERVAGERLNLAGTAPGPDPKRIQLFTFLLANSLLTRAAYAMAEQRYETLLRLDARNELSADFQLKSYLGMAEALMAQARAGEAERLLKPMVFAQNADPARPAAFHEELFNSYAVTLAEAGQKAMADRIIAEVGRESSRPPELDQQDRDLLSARLLRARGSFGDAEAIYRKWIQYWDERPPVAGGLRRDQAEPRLRPLQEYTHFLTLRNRETEARAARDRLRKLEREYDVLF
jgi:hypothetical protein